MEYFHNTKSQSLLSDIAKYSIEILDYAKKDAAPICAAFIIFCLTGYNGLDDHAPLIRITLSIISSLSIMAVFCCCVMYSGIRDSINGRAAMFYLNKMRKIGKQSYYYAKAHHRVPRI